MRHLTKLKKKPTRKLRKVKPRQEKWTEKKADELLSKVVRLERGTCQAKGYDKCRCGGSLQCCHIVGRGLSILRFDKKNVLVLCAGHHNFFHNHESLFWHDFMPNYYPEELDYCKTIERQFYEDLRAARPIKRLKHKDIILKLRDELTTLQQEKNM